MDMDHLIGSEIRYLGTLHEINPEQSTIALEEVYSFGTEGRPSKDFIPASNQKFDYIVFRGSDVKDIKIADEQKENKQFEANVPNDPAILNASRPGQPSPVDSSRKQPPFSPAKFQEQQPPLQQPPPPHFQNYYPQYDRGFGPPPGGIPPGAGFRDMPYGPPPPGYFGPPGPSFPQNHGQFPPPPLPPQMPLGPPGQLRPSGAHQQPQLSSQAPNELPVNDRIEEAAINRLPTPISTISPAPGPTPPNDSKPSVSEALRPTPTAPRSDAPSLPAAGPIAKTPLAGSKGYRVIPALPMMVNNKASAPLAPSTVNRALGASAANTSQSTAASAAPPTQLAMEEANRQARAAVANAMAKMNTHAQSMPNPPKSGPSGNTVEALTQKVGEMRASDGFRGSGRGGARGQRGNFRGAPRQGRKIEIPTDDYDFESANAKFNKEDMIKEATVPGSPIAESLEDGPVQNSLATSATNGEVSKESLSPTSTETYNKSSSFFDNISSEAKDREQGGNQAMGRGWRGEEIRKNLETFGQGSVDGGFRGRGRGGVRGRGRPYGGQRGYGHSRGNGQRGRGRGEPEPAHA